MTMFSSQSDLVKVTLVVTPMLLFLHHRTFRCIRVGGPARSVSLTSSAGPTCQSHAHFLLPREPPPAPSLRHRAPTRRRCSTRSAPVPPKRRRSRTAPPRPRHARSAPAPRPRRACVTRAPPVPRRAAAHHRRQRTFYSRSPSCSTPLEVPPSFEPCFEFPAPLVRARSRCSRICSKGISSIFVKFSSLILQGMSFTPPWHVSCFLFISFTHDHL